MPISGEPQGELLGLRAAWRLWRRLSGYDDRMGMMSKIVKAGMLKKVYDEARKPENQRKIKEAVASMQQKRAKGRGGSH